MDKFASISNISLSCAGLQCKYRIVLNKHALLVVGAENEASDLSDLYEIPYVHALKIELHSVK